MRLSMRVQTLALVCLSLHGTGSYTQQVKAGEQENVVVHIIGYADRWSDYGSTGAMPSERDFLATEQKPRSAPNAAGEFIKVRFLYFPQDKTDPKAEMAKGTSRKELDARREPTCDERFSDLSKAGVVSALDPEGRPSGFKRLFYPHAKLPPPTVLLPCYEVRWPGRK